MKNFKYFREKKKIKNAEKVKNFLTKTQKTSINMDVGILEKKKPHIS